MIMLISGHSVAACFCVGIGRMPLESSLTVQKHRWACCPKTSIYEGPGQGLGIILCILKIKFTEMYWYYSIAL